MRRLVDTSEADSYAPSTVPAKQKVSVSIAHEDLEWVRARAAREQTSLSAELAALIRAAREHEQQLKRQRAAIDRYTKHVFRGKPPTAKEIARAQRDLKKLGL